MQVLDWSDIDACPTCSALVPARLMTDHVQWHDRIAAVAIESTDRLDQLAEDTGDRRTTYRQS